MSSTLRQLASGRAVNRLLGRAIHRYGLIRDGDRILVGVSGGKDSLSLAYLLAERLGRIPIKYELLVAHVHLGFTPRPPEALEAHFREQGYRYHIELTDIGPRAQGPENRENPCFLCARLRRKRLFELAAEYGCNKLALGHNLDDIIETFFINVIFSSEISTMLPAQECFGGAVTLIRPLALCEEAKIVRLAGDLGLPVIPSECPSQATSRRREIKELLGPIFARNRRLKGNVFRALSNVRLDYLPGR